MSHDQVTSLCDIADSIVVQNFVQLKAIPYRICDYADDVSMM